MKILTEKQRLKVLKELAAIRHIATHLIFEDDRKVRVEYVDKAIENVAGIAFDVCGEEAATLGMTQLMHQFQEFDNANGTPMGYTAKKGSRRREHGMSYEFEGLFASQGWQCPICKRVYSPYTPMCMYCGNGKQAYTVSTGTEHIHTPDGKIGVTDVYPGFIPPVSDCGNSKTAPSDMPITK